MKVTETLARNTASMRNDCTGFCKNQAEAMTKLHTKAAKKKEKMSEQMKSLKLSNLLMMATFPLKTSKMKKVKRKVPMKSPKKLIILGNDCSGFSSSSFF